MFGLISLDAYKYNVEFQFQTVSPLAQRITRGGKR
jgi:hypothetical protein